MPQNVAKYPGLPSTAVTRVTVATAQRMRAVVPAAQQSLSAPAAPSFPGAEPLSSPTPPIAHRQWDRTGHNAEWSDDHSDDRLFTSRVHSRATREGKGKRKSLRHTLREWNAHGYPPTAAG